MEYALAVGPSNDLIQSSSTDLIELEAVWNAFRKLNYTKNYSIIRAIKWQNICYGYQFARDFKMICVGIDVDLYMEIGIF